MKYLYTILFLLLFYIGAIAETDVQINLTDPQFGLSQTTNRTVLVQAESGVSVNGQNVLLPFRLTFTTDTNGICTASNLFGSAIAGWYHITVPAPPQRADFDIWVQSTNLGLVSASSIIGTFGASTYPAQAFAWSAAVADNRYAMGTNQQGSFAQIGQLISTSNGIVSQFPYLTNGLAATNYSGFTTPAQATNIAGNVYSNNPAGYLISAATNGLASTNLVFQFLSTAQFLISSNNLAANALSNLIATNNALTNQIGIALSNAVQVDMNSSNALQIAKQPASMVLSNLASSGAFTNPLASGVNITLSTNLNIVSINATNQTFLTNALASTNFVMAQISLVMSNDLTTMTNYVNSQTNNFATTNFVTVQISASTNGSASVNFVTNLVAGTSNGLYSALQNGTNWVNTNLTALALLIGANGTNNTLAVSNTLSISSLNNATNAAKAATNGLPAFVWGLGSASQSNASAFVTPYQLGTNLATYATTNQLNSATSSVVQIDQNFSLNIGANATNNDLVTSNGVILSASNLIASATNNLPPYVWGLGSASQSNASAFYPSSNPSNFISVAASGGYVKSTNGYAQHLTLDSNVVFQTATNIMLSQDIIGVRGAQVAQANGTYRILSSGYWTNYQSQGFTILLSGGNYYIRTNATSLYQSPIVNTNWTTVLGSGSGTPPTCAYGFYFDVNGVVIIGSFDSSNLTSQIIQNIGIYGITNGATYPVILPNTNNLIAGLVAANSTNANYLGGIYYTVYTTTNDTRVKAITVDSSMTATPSAPDSRGGITVALTAIGGGGGTNAQMVFQGTNNPNGFQTAPMGAIYNQFYVGTSNFWAQWVNTNGVQGWQ